MLHSPINSNGPLTLITVGYITSVTKESMEYTGVLVRLVLAGKVRLGVLDLLWKLKTKN